MTAVAMCCLMPPVPATARPRNRNTAAARVAPVHDPEVLASLIYPASLDAAVVEFTFASIVGPGYRADPQMRQAEAEHPGFIARLLAASEPVLARGRAEALPNLWATMGAVYAKHLSPAELHEAIAFHQSPAARRMIDGMVEAMRHAPPPGDAANVELSPPAQTVSVTAAKAAFDATPAGRKLLDVTSEIGAINAAWNSAPPPGTDSRMQAAMDGVAACLSGPSAAATVRQGR